MTMTKIRDIKEKIGITLVTMTIVTTFAFLLFFIYIIFSRGFSVISWDFFTQMPLDGMTKGGIMPAIVGTFWLTVMTLFFAILLGVPAAIFLSEYARPAWLVKIIRLAINTLAAVPSIVYGLFGLAVFVVWWEFDISLVAGSMTLAVLILPIIINTSEEAFKAVPQSFREASLGLGATKRQTIMKVVLPTAMPGIITGGIISVGRAAGETAPIIFTAATFFSLQMPTSIYDECMALPFHIYALMTEGTSPAEQVPIAYGTAIVLLVLVMAINLIAVILRYKMRRNKQW